MTPTLEVEQRYKVADASATIALLAQHGAILRDEQHLVDQWFVPLSIHTRADHDRWFDDDHGVAYRIRTIDAAGSGDAPDVTLDSKQLTEANNHNTFAERVVMRGDKAAMERLLEHEGYYNWLTIDKRRRRFQSPRPDLIIVMDSVGGVRDALGVDTALELEYQGSATREQALAIINDFAVQLGLQPADQFAKSLTVESMRVLAHFQ